jgi:flagellar hook-length control protein FliK
MSQTNTDYLFQVIAPQADRSTSTSRTGDDATGFSDHLSYASTSVFNVLHQPSPNETLNRSQRREDTSETARNEQSSEAAAPVASSSAPDSSAAESESHVAAPAESISQDDPADDERDAEAGGEVAAGVAGVSQEASKQTTVKHGDNHNGQHEATSQAKEKVEAAAKVGQKGAAAGGETTKDAKNYSEEVVAVENVVSGAVAADENAESAADSADGKQIHNGKKAGKGALEATQAAAQADANAAHDSKKATNGDLTAAIQADAAPVANGKAAASKAKSDDSEPADDDARGDKSTDRGNTKSDPTSAAKTDAAPVVGAIAADLADSTSSGASKEYGEGSVKPAHAKHETAVGPLARAMRAASDITRGGKSEGSSDLPPVDPARFIGRVAKAFQTANERDGSVQLRLSPPDLGSLKLQLTVKDGVMSAALETDNANARRLLLDHLPALRDRLAEQNIRVDRFDVDVRQEGNSGGAQADPRGFQQNPYQQQPEQTDARRGNAAQQRVAEVAAPVQPAVAPKISSDGINLVI